MRFVIDRSKWRCGGNGHHRRGSGETRLLNSDGYMCCLGLVSEQLGAGEGDLLEQGDPEGAISGSFDAEYRQRLRGLLSAECELVDEAGGNTQLTIDAIGINDNPDIGDGQRESLLRQEFISRGHEIEFQGEYTTSNLPAAVTLEVAKATFTT